MIVASCSPFASLIISPRWRCALLAVDRFRGNIAAPDPIPSLAELIYVVLFRLKPIRNALLFLASVSKLLHFLRLHDEAHRVGRAGIGNDNPPVTNRSIKRSAERY